MKDFVRFSLAAHVYKKQKRNFDFDWITRAKQVQFEKKSEHFFNNFRQESPLSIFCAFDLQSSRKRVFVAQMLRCQTNVFSNRSYQLQHSCYCYSHEEYSADRAIFLDLNGNKKFCEKSAANRISWDTTHAYELRIQITTHSHVNKQLTCHFQLQPNTTTSLKTSFWGLICARWTWHLNFERLRKLWTQHVNIFYLLVLPWGKLTFLISIEKETQVWKKIWEMIGHFFLYWKLNRQVQFHFLWPPAIFYVARSWHLRQ